MPRRLTAIIVGLALVFIVLNLIGISIFYGFVPFGASSTDISYARSALQSQQQQQLQRAGEDPIAASAEDPILSTFLASLKPFKRLLPARHTPQCSHANQSSALKIQNFDRTTKPGPFPNLSARHTIEASLHLLDVVEDALLEGDVCFWLDGSSLLGAYHHATPLPYSSYIEFGILLSDLRKTLTALRLYSKESVQRSVSLEEAEGISRLVVEIPSESPSATLRGGIVHINIYSTHRMKLLLNNSTKSMDVSHIFPLQRALFSGRTVWVPKNTETYLQEFFGEEELDRHPLVIDWGTMTYVTPTTTLHSDYYPLVSIVIVTHERYEFLAKSVDLIHRQDYPNLEIVIIDDSAKHIEDTPYAPLLQVPNLTYRHLKGSRLSIGKKRNIGVELARGVIIAHWDDDDYFREHRTTEQVAPILSGDVDMTVLEHHYYFHLPSKSFFIVKRTSAWGPHFGTFMFKRSIFEQGVRYPDSSLAEDYAFAEFALKRGATIRVLDNSDGKHVYTRHYNTWEFEINEYIANVRRVERPEFFSDEDFKFFTTVVITPPKSKPPNHYAAAEISWNRPEFRPGWRDSKWRDKSLGVVIPDVNYPQYPHPPKGGDGLTTGEKVGVGVGVTGAFILVVGTFIGGAIYYISYRRRTQMEQGYIALSQEFNL